MLDYGDYAGTMLGQCAKAVCKGSVQRQRAVARKLDGFDGAHDWPVVVAHNRVHLPEANDKTRHDTKRNGWASLKTNFPGVHFCMMEPHTKVELF